MNDNYIKSDEFEQNLVDNYIFFENGAEIGICVSGGCDSLALMILMNNWAQRNGCSIKAIHFDHGLRISSSIEAKQIKDLASKMNISFKSLKWKGIKPKTDIMNKARDARYQSIIKYCQERKIIHLMTAHHLNDFIETYYMRVKRKFTTSGLNSIPSKFVNKNLIIYRPLLNFRKTRLVKTCEYHKIKWIKDYSNFDPRYERVRVRNFLKNNEYLDQNLKMNIKFDLRINKNLESNSNNFFLRDLKFYDYGVFEFNLKSLSLLSLSLRIEILKKILITCSGNIYPPRMSSLQTILEKISKPSFSRHTLHHCILEKKKDKIIIYKEFYSVQREENKVRIFPNKSIYWDKRFRIKSKKNFNCKFIVDNDWAKIYRDFKLNKKIKGIKFEILKTLPLLYREKKYVIPFVLNEEDLKKEEIEIFFEPTIPLSKKNF